MPVSLTEMAVAIIDAAPAHGPLLPLAYAEALPPEAADLAHVLRQPAVIEAAARYAAADAAAVHAQRRANGMAWCAAAAGFLAAALSGLLFYLNALSVPRDVELAVSALQVAALAVSLAGSSWLIWRKPFSTWRAERGAAEAARVDLFSRLIAASAPTGASAGSLLLPLKLECFRRHLLEHQVGYFRERGESQARGVRRWAGVRYLALILVLTAAVPVLAHALAIALPQLAALAPGLARATARALAAIPLTGDVAKKSYWLAGFVGAYLQGFLTSTSSISMAERNVEKFKAMQAHLWTTYCRPAVLAGVREAAAQDDQDPVVTYADLVAGDLATEASDWGAWHQARSELALRLLGQARPGPGG